MEKSNDCGNDYIAIMDKLRHNPEQQKVFLSNPVSFLKANEVDTRGLKIKALESKQHLINELPLNMDLAATICVSVGVVVCVSVGD